MLRARLYGQAVALLDRYLGTAVRQRVMDRLAESAGALQKGAPLRGVQLKDPWLIIADACSRAGVSAAEIRALEAAYRLQMRQYEPWRTLAADEAVVAQLRAWRAWDAIEKALGRR
ncbi:MAG TPA: hypothetical protein VFK80_10215 [Limnochordia bacterium]|nr:hypothetical protein [Limnochordia bacterium]